MAGVVFKKSLLVLPVYRHLATRVGPQPHFLIIITIPFLILMQNMIMINMLFTLT